jgi:signal transduction histidine kinase
MPAPHFEAVRLEEVLGEVVRLFDNQLARPGAPPIEVRREVEGPLAPIRADPEQLGRALRNLVANAIEAMPDGGTLTLRARRRGGRVLLEVADTGEGLSEEARARLFTPYHTTKRTGTGLGLAIVQSIVSDHRGKIAVESERGRGTTFHIELPA